MKKELNKICKILSAQLPEIKLKYNISAMEIFGSYIRNEQKSTSDLDILVSYKKTPDLLEFVELENYLSDLLQLKVDLVMRSALKPNIGKIITSESRPVV